MLAVAPSTRSAMGRNGQLLLRGRRGARRQPRAAAPQRRRLRAVQLLPDRLPDRRQAGDARLLPAARGRRRRPDPRRGRGAELIVSTAGALAASECRAGVAERGAPTGRPFDGPRPRGVILAGGAFGTPELLLRSGFRSPGGELGRNLRIHPACWVGARFDEEVRGWDGRHAELRRRRVGGPRAAARGDLHAARLRRPVAARHRRRAPASACSTSATSPRPASTSPTSRPGGSASARDGSLRIGYQLTRDDADRLVFGIARAAELFYAAGATRGLPPDLRRSDPAARADRRARGLAPAARARCGSRPFTRWAPRAWTPIRAGA